MNTHPTRSRGPRPANTGTAGFTLVEVCLALGIIAFAVLPLVGLLSVGLDTYRNAETRARATQVLNQLATALQNALPATSTTATNAGVTAGTYVALAPLPQTVSAGAISWTPAAPLAVATDTVYYTVYFDESGNYISDSNSVASSSPAAPPSNARLAAAIVLTPPSTSYDAGTAQITVGWPATPLAGPFYGNPSGATTQCLYYGTVQGHVENTIKLPAIAAAQ